MLMSSLALLLLKAGRVLILLLLLLLLFAVAVERFRSSLFPEFMLSMKHRIEQRRALFAEECLTGRFTVLAGVLASFGFDLV